MQISDSIATFRRTTSFVNSINKQAIVKPDSFNGIAGFIFDITDNDSIQFQSDITDHFIEDNTAINDHIALKPEIIKVTGFTGELTNRVSTGIAVFELIVEKLEIISEYLPITTISLQNAYSDVKSAYETVNNAEQGVENLYNLFLNNDPEDKITNQSKAFSYFYSLWLGREIFTVDTPLKTFTNMAIENMEVIQAESNSISEFNITFKKLRFSKAVVVNNNQGRRINQLNELIDKGSQRGEEKNRSLIKIITDGTIQQ